MPTLMQAKSVVLFIQRRMKVYQGCTSDPGRCRRRTRRQYVLDRIPGKHKTNTLSGIQTLLKRGFIIDKRHMFWVIFH